MGCLAGALDEREYSQKLASAGFEQIEIEPTRVYRVEDAREFLTGKGLDVDALAPQVDGKFLSAFMRAVKPQELNTAWRSLQRSLPLHREFRALHHGRSDSES